MYGNSVDTGMSITGCLDVGRNDIANMMICTINNKDM